MARAHLVRTALHAARRMASLLLCVTALVWQAACGGPPAPGLPADVGPAAPAERPHGQQEGARAAGIRARALFVCDSKYAEADACDEDDWLAAALVESDGPDLFAHDDGGPSGAVWNGDAAILVIAEGAHVTLRMGATTLRGDSSGEQTWFRVPFETWYPALRGGPEDAFRRAAVIIDGVVVGEVWYAEGE